MESDYGEDELILIQVEVLVGCQRIAQALDDDIQIDTAVTEALSARDYSDAREGFPNEKELSSRFGSLMSSYTTKIDAIIITTDRIYITEIKSRNHQITGLHDLNEGVGQVLMNRDCFQEDYGIPLRRCRSHILPAGQMVRASSPAQSRTGHPPLRTYASRSVSV